MVLGDFKTTRLLTLSDYEKFLVENGISWFKIEVELQHVTILIPSFRYIFRRGRVLKKMKLFAPAAVQITFKGWG